MRVSDNNGGYAKDSKQFQFEKRFPLLYNDLGLCEVQMLSMMLVISLKRKDDPGDVGCP